MHNGEAFKNVKKSITGRSLETDTRINILAITAYFCAIILKN